MKKIILTLSFVLTGWLFCSPVFAQAGEVINHYQVSIRMLPDARLSVTEKIDYDSGGMQRHGINRVIVYKYDARGGHYNLRISNLNVTDEAGSPYPVKISYSGSNQIIRIGDPDRTFAGRRSFVISYDVSRAVNSFDEWDELYWNAVAPEWQIPIRVADASVTVPEAAAGRVRLACYTGVYGSQSQECAYDDVGDTATFRAENLDPGEGLSVVVGLPKGVIIFPAVLQRTVWVLEDNWILFLPVLMFGVMFAIWRSRGRDPKSKAPIVAQYEAPDNLGPAELAYLLRDRTDNRDITAEIIRLAEQGYLIIRKTETKTFFGKKDDFSLIKTRSEDDLKDRFDRELMRALFANSAKDLAAVLPEDAELRAKAIDVVRISDLAKIRNLRSSLGVKEIPKKLTELGYYTDNPDKVRVKYMAAGIILFFLAVWFGGLLSIYSAASVAATGIIVAAFGYFMPSRTQKGAETRQLALGLKEYISVAEKDRLEFHNAPDATPQLFEKLLPYAVALGVTDQWAKKFEGIYNTPPAWYQSTGTGFNPVMLGAFVTDFNGSFGSAMATSGKGGGSSAWGGGSGFSGGFSGGGFGGGGGSSW